MTADQPSDATSGEYRYEEHGRIDLADSRITIAYSVTGYADEREQIEQLESQIREIVDRDNIEFVSGDTVNEEFAAALEDIES
ncbi:MAG: hypothetical protein ABEH56_07200 [Salinirussus sp.]